MRIQSIEHSKLGGYFNVIEGVLQAFLGNFKAYYRYKQFIHVRICYFIQIGQINLMFKSVVPSSSLFIGYVPYR